MGSGWKIRVGKMIEIKDVIEGKKILYSCGICEVRYGLDVEIELNLLNGYSERKYQRVFDFMNVHEKCDPPMFGPKPFRIPMPEEKDYGHPLINYAVKLFEPQRIQEFPLMGED